MVALVVTPTIARHRGGTKWRPSRESLGFGIWRLPWRTFESRSNLFGEADSIPPGVAYSSGVMLVWASVAQVWVAVGWNPSIVSRTAKNSTRVAMKIAGACSASATSRFW